MCFFSFPLAPAQSQTREPQGRYSQCMALSKQRFLAQFPEHGRLAVGAAARMGEKLEHSVGLVTQSDVRAVRALVCHVVKGHAATLDTFGGDACEASSAINDAATEYRGSLAFPLRNSLIVDCSAPQCAAS